MYIRKINNDSWRDGIFYYKDPECTILHREDGPAVQNTNGYKAWYFNNKLHRTDGPAVEYVNKGKAWYLNGKYHREDGPAIESANGAKFYYLNNENLSKEEYIQYIKLKTLCPAKIAKILKRCI